MGMIAVGEEAFGNSDPIPVNTSLKMSVFDIDKVPVKSGENAGKEQLVVTFKVTEQGPYLGREVRYNNLPLYKSKGSWALVGFAEAVGWATDPKLGVDVPDDIAEIKAVQGVELIVKVGLKPADQNGNVYNRANGYKKLPSGGGSTPKSETEKVSWGSV